VSDVKDVRVYGNQYGTWVEISGKLLLDICWALRIDITHMSVEDHDAIKDFLTKAIEEKCRAVLPADHPSMVGP
jgi:hypothetical protein